MYSLKENKGERTLSSRSYPICAFFCSSTTTRERSVSPEWGNMSIFSVLFPNFQMKPKLEFVNLVMMRSLKTSLNTSHFKYFFT